MSQTVTYKTKYKSLNDIKDVLDDLVGRGVFGKNAKILERDDDGNMDTGVYYHYDQPKKKNIVFRIKDGGGEYFTEGFYDKGFAIAQDPQTKDIELVFDYNSGRDAKTEKVTEAVKKHVDDMIKTGVLRESFVRNTKDILKNMKVNNISDTEFVIEGELTPEQLRAILGK